MIQLELIKIGNSIGAILPPEALARLRVDAGDVVYLTDLPYGYRITGYDPAAQPMSAAERVMKKRRAALRELG